MVGWVEPVKYSNSGISLIEERKNNLNQKYVFVLSIFGFVLSIFGFVLSILFLSLTILLTKLF